MQRFTSFFVAVLFAGISFTLTAQQQSPDNLLAFSFTSDKNWVFQSAENPGSLMIDFGAFNTLPYKIHIFSESGQLVYVDDLDFVASTVIYSVDLEELKKGRYLLSVSSPDDKVYAHHFTKE